jgi:hypothetical protein
MSYMHLTFPTPRLRVSALSNKRGEGKGREGEKWYDYLVLSYHMNFIFSSSPSSPLLLSLLCFSLIWIWNVWFGANKSGLNE